MNVFVWGWDYSLNENSSEDTYKAIQELIAGETVVNFYICTTDCFEMLCLKVIKQIKNERADIKITTTFITRNKITMSFEEETKQYIADGFDDVILYPEYIATRKRHINFNNLRKRMRKWTYSFVDTLLVNFYPTLNFREIDEIEKLKNLNLNVVNIYNRQTEKNLHKLLEELDPNEAKIYSNTRLKIPFTVTAKELGITNQQVSDIFYGSLFDIVHRYEHKYKNEK